MSAVALEQTFVWLQTPESLFVRTLVIAIARVIWKAFHALRLLAFAVWIFGLRLSPLRL